MKFVCVKDCTGVHGNINNLLRELEPCPDLKNCSYYFSHGLNRMSSFTPSEVHNEILINLVILVCGIVV